MKNEIIMVLAWVCLTGFLIFLILGIVALIKKKHRNSIKWFIYTAGTVAVFILLIQFAAHEGSSTAQSVNNNSKQEVENVEGIQNTRSLNDDSFNISLKTMQYNKEVNSLFCEYETGLPNGTIVDIFLFPLFPDSWGEEYKPFYEYTKSLEQKVETTVKDGKISYTFSDSDLNGLLLPNAVLYTTLTFPVNEQENTFIKDEIQTEEDFNKRYPELVKIQNENPQEAIYAFMENESGYDLKFYESYEMKEAYTLEDILGVYEKGYIDYKQLEKNPNKYTGQFVKYQGQILQIMEDDKSTEIRLAVTKDSYGYDINDVLYITYSGTTPFVEDDIITIYGKVKGPYTYESQAGYQITLPLIEAEIIQ